MGRAGRHERAAQVRASLGALAADNDERIELLSRENGKVRSECDIEMHVLENRFELAAGLADAVAAVRELPAPPFRTQVSYLPLGVVSLIVPFNWPLAILAASLPQALVAGNTVVVKAPPTTPLAFVRTIELIAAELPPGVLNVVSGHDAVLGPVLIQDPRVRKVGFTGSVAGGKRIMAMSADNLTRVLLELGGNDPAIVLEDAEVTEETIGKLYVGAFLTTGQVCMAMKRLYVHRSRYDAVVEGLSGALGAQSVGPGWTRRHDGAAEQRAPARLRDGLLAEGARRRRGARAGRGCRRRGVRPRATSCVRRSSSTRARDARIVTEEQFGPTLPILPFDDEQDAIAQANDTWSGLCSRSGPPTPSTPPRRGAAAHRHHVGQRPQRAVPTTARRSAASARAAWAARWARRASSPSPTRTRCRPRRSTAVRLSRMQGCREGCRVGGDETPPPPPHSRHRRPARLGAGRTV